MSSLPLRPRWRTTPSQPSSPLSLALGFPPAASPLIQLSLLPTPQPSYASRAWEPRLAPDQLSQTQDSPGGWRGTQRCEGCPPLTC